jgi:hypothetical protein
MNHTHVALADLDARGWFKPDATPTRTAEAVFAHRDGWCARFPRVVGHRFDVWKNFTVSWCDEKVKSVSLRAWSVKEESWYRVPVICGHPLFAYVHPFCAPFSEYAFIVEFYTGSFSLDLQLTFEATPLYFIPAQLLPHQTTHTHLTQVALHLCTYGSLYTGHYIDYSHHSAPFTLLDHRPDSNQIAYSMNFDCEMSMAPDTVQLKIQWGRINEPPGPVNPLSTLTCLNTTPREPLYEKINIHDWNFTNPPHKNIQVRVSDQPQIQAELEEFKKSYHNISWQFKPIERMRSAFQQKIIQYTLAQYQKLYREYFDFLDQHRGDSLESINQLLQIDTKMFDLNPGVIPYM